MNRISSVSRISVVSLMLAAGTVLAVIWSPSQAADEKGASGLPKIQFEKLSHDFGTVIQGESVSHIFKFTNAGTGDLILQRPTTSCGCTVALLSASRIAPGGEGEIEATFHSVGRTGHQMKKILVSSNDPENPTSSLEITCDIKTIVTAQPQMLRFAALPMGQEQEQAVVLTPDEGVEIKGVKSPFDFLKVELEPADEGSRSRKLVARLTKDAPTGTKNGQVMIAISGAKQSSFTVPVWLRVVGEIIVTPESVIFPVVKKGERRYMAVRISRPGKEGFRVLEAASNNRAVTTELKALQEGTEYEVGVWLEPDVPVGPLKNAEVVVKTNSDSQPAVKIPVIAAIKE